MYIDEIILKRKSMRTTVFLVETLDQIRIRNFIYLNHRKAFDIDFDKIYIYDIQQGEVFQVERDLTTNLVNITRTKDSLEDIYDAMKKGHTILLIITYVYREEQARRLEDYLLSIAMDIDDKIYVTFSTVVVFTSSLSLFSEVLRKFGYTATAIASTPEERKRIITKVVQEIIEGYTHKYGEEATKKLKRKLKVKGEHITASSGLDLHLVETATLESIYKYREIRTEYYTQYKINYLKQYGIEYVEPKYGFEAVGGYNLLKEYIRNRIVKLIRKPEIAKKYSLEPPRGIILFGLPGTGKTFLAKALAKEVGLPLLKLDPSTFLRGIVGQTEARVKQVTTLIESFAPVIVFIDEIDQLAMRRGRVMSTDSGVSRRLTNMLLDWLGDRDRKSIIIGATNFISDLDEAFIRPGRIDELIPVLLPDEEARAEILKIHSTVLRHVPLNDDVDFNELARETYGWTGAELEKLVKESSFLAYSENSPASMRHFREAMKGLQPNISERERKLEEMIREAEKLENVNKRFLREIVLSYTEKESKAKKLASML